MPSRAKSLIVTVSLTIDGILREVVEHEGLQPEEGLVGRSNGRCPRGGPGLVALREPKPRERMPTLWTVCPLKTKSAG